MGSDLFRVTVTAKAGLRVTLRVEAVHPDAGAPPANESFALMVLREASAIGELAKAVAIEDTRDAEWQDSYANGFVAEVVARDPIAGPKPKATLEVTVTHAAWVAHLEKGATWSSHAWAIVAECELCPPIAPAVGPPVLDDDLGAGFLYLPRQVWGTLPDAPDLLEVAAYAPSAYAVVERIVKPTAIPDAWLGYAVRVEAWSQPEDVALLSTRGAEARWATISAGAYGTGGGKVDAIGRLALVHGRRGTRLSYARILGRLRAERVALTVHGDQLDVKFRIPPGPHGLAIDGAVAALAYLAGDAPTSTPIGRALADDRARIGGDPPADDYIYRCTVDPPSAIDLDALEAAEVRAVLRAPWPIATLRIAVTEPRWLAHLDTHAPGSVGLVSYGAMPPSNDG